MRGHRLVSDQDLPIRMRCIPDQLGIWSILSGNALTCEVPCFVMVSTWRLRRIKTATSNLGDLGNAAETGRTCATGAPYCLPFAPLVCEPSRGSAVGIEWGNRGGAAGDIEDLASKLCCWRADSDVACRDLSDRGIAPERRNAECESC